MRYPNARILIFAKAPIPGQVKTRLIPTLGPAGAAELARDLLERLVRRLAGARLAPVELWCSPDPGHPLFRDLSESAGVALRTQRGEDLGERLSAAAEDALGRAEAVLLVGADIPELDADYCASALSALADFDAVLGPAEDGGYVLLGLKAPAPELFTDMPWGGERVAAITRGRIASLGLRCSERATLWDLDRPEDLLRYRRIDALGDFRE
ncbi:TIGR04282 family arsenosugar biosynthesis glycosyltransferase [Thiocapsa sp.]|uniref:TIGR04282 family arsenosugar biosynthesis glycosyltransferase n=1 Tax=Thiocapsa sp. TaxID=2024551 RepID=UPI00345A63EE